LTPKEFEESRDSAAKALAEFKTDMERSVAQFKAAEGRMNDRAERAKSLELKLLYTMTALVFSTIAQLGESEIAHEHMFFHHAIGISESTLRLDELASKVPNAEAIKKELQEQFDEQIQGLRNLRKRAEEQLDQIPRAPQDGIYK
jgi:hypothetical protein